MKTYPYTTPHEPVQLGNPAVVKAEMVYCKDKPSPFLVGCYDTIMREAPVDYMEDAERFARNDLYFVSGIPAELFTDHVLRFHYTEQ